LFPLCLLAITDPSNSNCLNIQSLSSFSYNQFLRKYSDKKVNIEKIEKLDFDDDDDWR